MSATVASRSSTEDIARNLRKRLILRLLRRCNGFLRLCLEFRLPEAPELLSSVRATVCCLARHGVNAAGGCLDQPVVPLFPAPRMCSMSK